ncbi:MAG: ABC transporter permease [Bacteroidota bacterium]
MFQNYFKIAWRNLARYKGHAFINIGGLSLGFACSILIYLFIQHNLQYDNFHKNSDRIYRVVTEEHRDDVDYEASVPPGFAHAFRTEYDYAEKVAKHAYWDNELITFADKKKLKENVAFVEKEFFEILNFPLTHGGVADLSEPNTAVLTESMARKFFGDYDPVGKTFQLGGKTLFRVVGVLKDIPETSLIKTEVFLAYSSIKDYSRFLANENGWGGISSNLEVFTLLRPNQSIPAIEKEIQGFVKKYRPRSKNVHHYKLQALADIHFDPRYSGGMSPNMLWIFGLIGFFLLLMASINFINISTAQSVNRSREVGIRKVLGGLRIHLFWQFMIETFMICLASLLIGISLSVLALPYFNEIFDLELSISAIGNLPSFGFALALLLGISFLAGTYPGFLLARIAPVLALKSKLNPKDAGGFSTRKVLVSVQFIISIILIIGTLVINKQMKYAINSDLGFERNGIVRVALPDTVNEIRLQSLKDRLENYTAIEQVSACFGSPGAADNRWGTSLVYNNNPETEEFQIQVKIGDVDYLDLFGLELVAGRNFFTRDSVDEFVVNEKLAEKLGLNSAEELLGKSLEVSGGFMKGNIVGVVEDFHDMDFHEGISPVFITARHDSYSELAIKMNLENTQASIGHIEKEWSEAFPDHLFEYEFLSERVENLYESEQQILSLSTVFSSLAVLIGCLGIYGMILFYVGQRTKEIGIRKVLGSSTFNILVLLTEDFFKLLGWAALIASPIAWYFMHLWLQNYNFQTELSWWVFAAAIGMIMTITILTISFQAIKAATAKPVQSLRTE